MIDMQQRQQALLEWINSDTPFQCQKLDMVSGDASFRRYFRFQNTSTKQSIIAVDAPPEHEDSSKFVNMALAYKQSGVNVPEVLNHNASLGFYCLQDFGDQQFASEVQHGDTELRYKQAIAQLPAIQACVSVNQHSLPLFDQALLDNELYLFTHWLIEVHLGLTLEADQVQLIKRSYRHLVDIFNSQPQVGIHRDYHSRNLMILDQSNIGVIDFQDAVVGPITYDLVSLLRDCYQSWPESTISALLQHAHQQHFSTVEFEQFKYWFDMTGIQRHIKASGIFCRLCHRDGKTGYLQDVPHTLNYIIDVGRRYDETKGLSDFVAKVIKPRFLRLGK